MIRLCIVVMSVLFCCSCATQQSVVKDRYVWPPPPDVARIEWLKTYSSQLDIERTSLQRFWDAVAGDDAPRSLLKPVEVKSVPELNKFFVSDIGRAAVVVFDLAGRELRVLDVPGGVPPMQLPLSVAVDHDGSIYVLERRSASVFVFDRFEKFQRLINLAPVSVTNPTSMIIDKKTHLMYVSDAASRKVVVVDLKGKLVRSIGSAGEGDGRFNLPVAMALNSKGHLVVADAFGASVQIFEQSGRFLRKFGQRGATDGNFQLIKSVAVDSSDNIYVVDGRNHNITILNEQGGVLLILGGYYASAATGKLAPGGFSIPVGIDIDSTDKIFVVDQMNTRVQVFQYYSDEYLRSQPR